TSVGPAPKREGWTSTTPPRYRTHVRRAPPCGRARSARRPGRRRRDGRALAPVGGLRAAPRSRPHLEPDRRVALAVVDAPVLAQGPHDLQPAAGGLVPV